MKTSEFTEFVSSFLPKSCQNTHIKAARYLIHIITLIYSFGVVELHRVHYADGEPFIRRIFNSKRLVFKLAMALGVVVPGPLPESNEAPEQLLRLANHHGIRVEALKVPGMTPYNVHYNVYVVVTFMEVVRKVMARLNTNDLQMLERAYRGHCHPDYSKPKRTLRTLFSGADPMSHLLRLAASEMPGALVRTAIVAEPLKFPVHPHPRVRPNPRADSHDPTSTAAAVTKSTTYRSHAPSKVSAPTRHRMAARQSSTLAPVPYALPGPMYANQRVPHGSGRRGAGPYSQLKRSP